MADPGVGIVNVNGTDTLPVTYVYTINTGTKGVLRVIGQTPTVTTDPYRVTASQGAINVVGQTPTVAVQKERTFSPANGVVNGAGYAASNVEVTQPSIGVGVVNVIGISPGPVTYVYTINTGTQGTLNVQGYQPTVLVGDVTPNGLVQVVGYTPVITRDKTFYPSAGRVNIQGAQAETGVAPGLGVINVTGSAPDVRRIGAGWRNPTNGVVRVAMTGTTPTVDIIRTIDGPAAGVINIAGGSPTSQQPGNVVDAEPQVGVVRLVGYTPSVTYNYRIDVGRGLVNVRGYAGATPKTRKPSVGIIRVSGNVVTVGRVAPVIDKREGGHGTDYDEWDQQIRREDELIVEMLKQWVEVA